MVKLSEIKKCMNCRHDDKPLKIDWIKGYNESKVALCDDCWVQMHKIMETSPKQAEMLRSL